MGSGAGAFPQQVAAVGEIVEGLISLGGAEAGEMDELAGGEFVLRGEVLSEEGQLLVERAVGRGADAFAGGGTEDVALAGIDEALVGLELNGVHTNALGMDVVLGFHGTSL